MDATCSTWTVANVTLSSCSWNWKTKAFFIFDLAIDLIAKPATKCSIMYLIILKRLIPGRALQMFVILQKDT
jgi:hypothetical protein